MTAITMAWVGLVVNGVSAIFTAIGAYYTAAAYRHGQMSVGGGVMPSRPRVWPLVLIGVVLVAISGTATYQMFRKKGDGQPVARQVAPPAPPPAPVFTCDMRIGEREYSDLLMMLRRLRPRRPDLEAHIVVEPGKEDSCQYAKDLHKVFVDANWVSHIVSRGSEPKGRGVWFYGFEHDPEAKQLCGVLRAQPDPEITCCGTKDKERFLNVWDVWVRSGPGGLTTKEAECLPLG